MTYATAVPILLTSFVYRTNVYWSVIHCIKRKPHLSVVWNWYHFVAIAILHQPRPKDSADINTRLQLSDTSSIPPMHGGFLLEWGVSPCRSGPPFWWIILWWSRCGTLGERARSASGLDFDAGRPRGFRLSDMRCWITHFSFSCTS